MTAPGTIVQGLWELFRAAQDDESRESTVDELLTCMSIDDGSGTVDPAVKSVQTFDEAGIPGGRLEGSRWVARTEGVTIELSDGSRFQIAVWQTK